MNIIKTNLNYRKPLVPLILSKVLFLIVHHIDAKFATPEDIHQWHLDNGWNGFGYNEYIRKDGTVYIGRGDNIGAQCANMNSKSFGIALEGNFDIEDLDTNSAQFKSLVERLKYHKERFKNLVEIGPHGKYVATTCPGSKFPFEQLLDAVNNINNEFINAVNTLHLNNIISSADYWLENAVEGKTVRGDYAQILIKNMSKKL